MTYEHTKCTVCGREMGKHIEGNTPLILEQSNFFSGIGSKDLDPPLCIECDEKGRLWAARSAIRRVEPNEE